MDKKDKPLGRPPMPPTILVKLEADVIQQARAVAPLLGKTMTAYLSEILRPVVSHDLAIALAKLKERTERRRPRG
jgi:hypothetical protein